MTKLLREPPLYMTVRSPEDIVGEKEGLFARHYTAWMKNERNPQKAEAAFSLEELETIGMINKELLAHGYRIREMQDGKLRFSMVCSGARNSKLRLLPEEKEKDGDKLSPPTS